MLILQQKQQVTTHALFVFSTVAVSARLTLSVLYQAL